MAPDDPGEARTVGKGHLLKGAGMAALAAGSLLPLSARSESVLIERLIERARERIIALSPKHADRELPPALVLRNGLVGDTMLAAHGSHVSHSSHSSHSSHVSHQSGTSPSHYSAPVYVPSPPVQPQPAPAERTPLPIPANRQPMLSRVDTLTGATQDRDFPIPYDVLAAAGNQHDADGQPLSFRVESVDSGVLTKNGRPVEGRVTLLGPREALVWHPSQGATGVVTAFKVRASDGSMVSPGPIKVSIEVARTVHLQGGREDTAFEIPYAALAAASRQDESNRGEPTAFRVESVGQGSLIAGATPVKVSTTGLAAGGTVLWTPPKDANGILQVGRFRPIYGSDVGGTPIEVAVDVEAVNDPPVITDGIRLSGAAEGKDFGIVYERLASAANPDDPDGDIVLLRIDSVVSGTLNKAGAPVAPGTTTVGPMESLTWNPPSGATGDVHAFSIRAWDGTIGSSNAVPVYIAVAPAAGVPLVGERPPVRARQAVASTAPEQPTGAPLAQERKSDGGGKRGGVFVWGAVAAAGAWVAAKLLKRGRASSTD